MARGADAESFHGRPVLNCPWIESQRRSIPSRIPSSQHSKAATLHLTASLSGESGIPFAVHSRRAVNVGTAGIKWQIRNSDSEIVPSRCLEFHNQTFTATRKLMLLRPRLYL